MVEHGWGLYEIRPIGLSLEDIFLKLTSKEEGVEQAALERAGGTGTDAARPAAGGRCQ